MYAKKYHRAATVVWLLTLLVSTPTAASPQKLQHVTVHEETLRKYAIEVVMPLYPEQARRRNAQGAAVAQVNVNEQGSVAQVEILEAPNPLISEAVTVAVGQWRFNPPTIRGKAVPIRGKLTFYFVIKGGKGQVENPKQFK